LTVESILTEWTCTSKDYRLVLVWPATFAGSGPRKTCFAGWGGFPHSALGWYQRTSAST